MRDHYPSHYKEFTTPYAGMPQVLRPDGVYRSQTRFGLYRWHIMDPVRFKGDLKVTMQALSWRSGRPIPAVAGRYFFRRLLVSNNPSRAVSKVPGKRLSRGDVSMMKTMQSDCGHAWVVSMMKTMQSDCGHAKETVARYA